MLWNMLVMVIPIVCGTHDTVPEIFKRGLEKIGNQRENLEHPD